MRVDASRFGYELKQNFECHQGVRTIVDYQRVVN